MISAATRRLFVLLLCFGFPELSSQVPEGRVDAVGFTIPYRFTHLVHSERLTDRGATADLRSRDPFLLYQLGKDLVNRQFRLSEGVYGRSGVMNVPLYAGYSGQSMDRETGSGGFRFARDHTSSCGFCHSFPYREPGAGGTIPSTGGMGRNTPHFFGAGLVEMLADQVEREILARYDLNHNGYLDLSEVTGGKSAIVEASPGGALVDYGDLGPDEKGVPRLNPVFRVWYVNSAGEILPEAVSLHDTGVAGYGLAMQVFGWGRGVRELPGGYRANQGAEAATLRGIFTGAADVHMGLLAHDPSQQLNGSCAESSRVRGAGGRSLISLNGKQQYDFGGSPDCGQRLTSHGISLDDPDHDGSISELTEGDVDAVEFFMLHAPAPAYQSTTRSEQGRAIFRRIGCARCHIENWTIKARGNDGHYPGDRRLFRFETAMVAIGGGHPGLHGRLILSSRTNQAGETLPSGDSYRVAGIYSDFKHWDIGPQFHERRFDGSVQREHRTAPLWGCADTAPYGHDGRFGTLEEVISAHSGDAEPEAARYRRLPVSLKRLMTEFLQALVLYSPEELPADIDGDSRVTADYTIGAAKVGLERFDPRFLFRTQPEFIEMLRVTNSEGRVIPLLLIRNVDEAYGLKLPYRLSGPGRLFPDAVMDDDLRAFIGRGH